MTREEREEAIEILDKFAHSDVSEYPLEVAIKAFERAIEALKVEPCDDAVSRKKAIEAAKCIWESNSEMKSFITMKMLKELPSVTPKQKMGKWIVDEAETNLYAHGTRIWACHCPECGKDPQEEYIAGTENWWLSKLPNFCPNCGMKLEGENE